jgi:imidazolonepropionase
MLRVIKKLKEKSKLLIKASFLGAHTYPLEYKDNHQGYIDLIINEMLPVIAKEKLADYIDAFCETGFFSPEETELICRAGMSHGLKPKIHSNQLNLSGGVEVGVKLGAISVDHLETMNESTIAVLANSQTIGTLLPTAAFFLRMSFQPARQLIDAGCAIALASDFNPGSSPSGNMNLVVAMSCIQMKMLPKKQSTPLHSMVPMLWNCKTRLVQLLLVKSKSHLYKTNSIACLSTLFFWNEFGREGDDRGGNRES